MPENRSPSAADPSRQSLVELRRKLLRLHKALVDFERGEYERVRGPLSGGAFLQALLQDQRFGWLRPYSELIVQIDEALADRESPVEEAQARLYARQVQALVSPETSPDSVSVERYRQARERSGDVDAAHVELIRALAPFQESAG